jgi:hypothetical protein
MTEKEWGEEVERAIAGSGLMWRLSAAWTERSNDLYCADVRSTTSGKDRTIRLACSEFITVAQRRAEIVRQLQRA